MWSLFEGLLGLTPSRELDRRIKEDSKKTEELLQWSRELTSQFEEAVEECRQTDQIVESLRLEKKRLEKELGR